MKRYNEYNYTLDKKDLLVRFFCSVGTEKNEKWYH